jgi:hypothetical protein
MLLGVSFTIYGGGGIEHETQPPDGMPGLGVGSRRILLLLTEALRHVL